MRTRSPLPHRTGYKQQAEVGDIDGPDYARFSKNLKLLIAAAEERAKEKSLPPVLRGRIGKHAAKEWTALADNLAVKREIIREILSIELLQPDADHPDFGPHRVKLAWTYGEPDPATVPSHRSGARERRTATPAA